ncbi:MAG TPA: hypothetical protein VKT83_05730 [bacterium]|jgi:hypothetical protein|nr:hypothetical protein [bacterium]
MRGTVAGFWLGALVAAVLFAATGGTTLDIRVTGTEAGRAQLEQSVDQGTFAGLLTPSAPALGVLHIKKRTWGVVTTYSETLAAPGARAAGAPDMRVLLTVPGAVTVTNAAGRDGRALVWTGLPGPEPAWAEARAVNWPAVVVAVIAAAISLRMARGKAG